MGHGSQGLFTQVGFSDPLQDDATQNHFNVANSNPLQSQVSLIPASFFFSVKNNNSSFYYEKLIACVFTTQFLTSFAVLSLLFGA